MTIIFIWLIQYPTGHSYGPSSPRSRSRSTTWITFLPPKRHSSQFFTATAKSVLQKNTFGTRTHSHHCVYSYRHSNLQSHYQSHDQQYIAETASSTTIPIPVFAQGQVDYSAANDYILAHYNQSHYFQAKDGEYWGDDAHSQRRMESFVDARKVQSNFTNETQMLEQTGMALVSSPIHHFLPPRTDTTNYDDHTHTLQHWSTVDTIQTSYLPELKRIISLLYPSKDILHCHFWNPMMRGENYTISRQEESKRDERSRNASSVSNVSFQMQTPTPTANVASMLHIDTDVGAYDSIHDLLRIIQKNQVKDIKDTTVHDDSYWNDMAGNIVNNHQRFIILNFWRNIGKLPVERAPLAILSTKYRNTTSSTLEQRDEKCWFPYVSPDMDKSQLYIFPNMTRDEVVVFYQYDRLASQPSDLWHCAVPSIQYLHRREEDDRVSTEIPRTSFDIRAFLVFNESVPGELDRFSKDRSKPILSFEESGCFCDEQAEKRKQ